MTQCNRLVGRHIKLIILCLSTLWAVDMLRAYNLSNIALSAHTENEFNESMENLPGDYLLRLLIGMGALLGIMGGWSVINRDFTAIPEMRKQFIVYCILSTMSVFALLQASLSNNLNIGDLRSSFGPLTVLSYALLFAGYNHKIWPYLKVAINYLAYLTAFCCLCICISRLSDLNAPSHLTRFYFSPFINTLAFISVWPTLTETNNNSLQITILKGLPVVVLGLISFLSLSRGWILISIILLFTYLYVNRAVFFKQSYVFIVLTSIAGMIAIFALRDTLNDRYEQLIDRIDEDSRLGQYEIFFSQMGMWDLLVGKGLKATYYFDKRRPDYGSFDNQLLLMLFKMGSLYTMLFVWLYLYPLFSLLTTPMSITEKMGAPLHMLLFLLASLGLSIFFGLEISLPIVLMNIFAGRNWYLYNSLIKSRHHVPINIIHNQIT